MPAILRLFIWPFISGIVGWLGYSICVIVGELYFLDLEQPNAPAMGQYVSMILVPIAWFSSTTMGFNAALMRTRYLLTSVTLSLGCFLVSIATVLHLAASDDMGTVVQNFFHVYYVPLLVISSGNFFVFGVGLLHLVESLAGKAKKATNKKVKGEENSV